MFSLFTAFAVVLAVLPSAFSLQDLLSTAFKRTEQFTAKILAQTSKPANATDAGDFVWIHYYDVNSCHAGEEFQIVSFKTNTCFDNSEGSSRWSCNGDKVHFDHWSGLGCSGTQTSSDYSPDQCFPPDQEPGTNVLTSSFSCSSDFAPPGAWYVAATYTDATCNSVYEANFMKNQVCVAWGTYALKIDYPKEYMYYGASDCSSAAPTVIDLSQTANTCASYNAKLYGKSFFSQL